MVEEREARRPSPESQTGPPSTVSRHLRLSSQSAVRMSVAGRGQLSPSSPRFPACSLAPAQVGDPQLDAGDDRRGRRGRVWMARLFRLPRTGLCPQEGTAVGGRSARGHEPGSWWRAGGSCRLGGQPEGATLNALGFLPPACGARGVAEGLLMVLILRAGPCGNVCHRLSHAATTRVTSWAPILQLREPGRHEVHAVTFPGPHRLSEMELR